MDQKKSVVKIAFVKTLPILAGYLFLGTGFGLIMSTGGYPVWWSMMMSIVIFSGALEYATVPLFAASFNPLSAFVLGLMLSARHLFYGIPMLKKYENTGLKKVFLIFGLTDEAFSLLSTDDEPKGVNLHTYYFLVTLFNYVYWNIGTVLGAVAGNLIPFDLSGLDFALTALFIVLFVEAVKNKQSVISGLTGLLLSALVLLLFGSSSFVIISMVLILLALLVERFFLEKKGKEGVKK